VRYPLSFRTEVHPRKRAQRDLFRSDRLPSHPPAADTEDQRLEIDAEAHQRPRGYVGNGDA
jgi:hypothetical protein